MVASPLHAQERVDWIAPSLLYASGSIADEVSTRRFLSNGSGCTEAATWIGGSRPDAWKLTATTIGGIAVVSLMHYAIYRAGKQTGHPKLAKALNVTSGVIGGSRGWRAAVNNVRDCPGGR